MLLRSLLLLLGVLALSLALPGARSTPVAPWTPPPLYLGLDAYRHWDKLAYLEIGDRVWGQTTADPAGSNLDSHQVLGRLANGERVLFDQVGPGLLTFMRMQETYGAPWVLSLDGKGAIPVAPSDLGQITPADFPARAFPYPLSLNPSQTEGSSILAAAIPFQQRLRWTSVYTNGNFYSLYRKLPYGSNLATWTGTEPAADVVALLRQAGSDVAPTGTYSQSGTLRLPAGETTLATLRGPAQVRALSFRVPYTDMVRFANTRLRIYWDGEPRPSVDAPVKFMAGAGAGVYQPAGRPLVGGWAANADGDGATYLDFNIYWPMPFAATARIALSATTATAGPAVAWRVRTEPFRDPPSWWGTFHATYSALPPAPTGADMTFLDVTGSGRIVGTVINFNRPGATLEGDPHLFLDDNHTPQIQVTGTEEWGLGGNYWRGGEQTTLPLGGHPSSINNPPGADIDGAALYRFLIADSIPFNRHAVVRWEHGSQDEAAEPYRAAIFWYGQPVQTAVLTDDFPVGDAAARAFHGYAAPGAADYTLSAAYEYPVHSPLSSAAGISTTGVTSFTLILDPANVGAFLRRQFDYGLPNQTAHIFLDGQPAGTWYSAGASTRVDRDGNVRRWREEEFPLPPTLTMGKHTVTVRVEFVPTTDPPNIAWTEFHYQLYSFVSPIRTFADVPPANPFYLYITCLARQGTMGGYADGNFRPLTSVTRGQLAKLIVNAAAYGDPIPTARQTFADVLPSSPFWEFIERAYARGAVDGYLCGAEGDPCPGRYFRPTVAVTRGQFAKIVAHVAGYADPIPATRQTFADVPATDPFWRSVEQVAQHGIISGYVCGSPPAGPCDPQHRPYFRPAAGLTRAQTAKILARSFYPQCPASSRQ